MRSVLCYGDSNTYGTRPRERGSRYPYEGRWPGVMRSQLDSDWLVIEEGLPGRTTCSDDPIEGAHLNGRTYLRPCLESHKPLDLIIIMLGTNDLKVRFQRTASDIALGMASLVQVIREDAFRSDIEVPEIVLVSPPPILPDLRGWDEMFEGGYEKSQQLADGYMKIAEMQGVGFLDAGEHAHCSTLDGFHIDDENATKLGKALAKMVQERWE